MQCQQHNGQLAQQLKLQSRHLSELETALELQTLKVRVQSNAIDRQQAEIERLKAEVAALNQQLREAQLQNDPHFSTNLDQLFRGKAASAIASAHVLGM